MLLINFTPGELARVRMTAGLGPVAESIFALDLFVNGRGYAANQWRRKIRTLLGDNYMDVEQLTRNCQPVPDLLWLLDRSADGADAGQWAEGRDGRRERAVVFEFCRSVILPYWGQLQSYLESEREIRGRIAITNGVEALFGALHSKVCWNPPVLEVHDEPDGEIHLNGRQILLSPTMFLARGRCAFVQTAEEGAPAALVFSVPGGLDKLLEAEDARTPGGQVLAALIGTTRAAALSTLTESCTTGALSKRLGISLAGASKHATVLREAGLISTTRHGNKALHTLTTLGMDLLQQPPGARCHTRETHRPRSSMTPK